MAGCYGYMAVTYCMAGCYGYMAVTDCMAGRNGYMAVTGCVDNRVSVYAGLNVTGLRCGRREGPRRRIGANVVARNNSTYLFIIKSSNFITFCQYVF